MKLIIDIPENDYNNIKEYCETHEIVKSTYSYIYHGTPLPDNATNGDVIKALFPYIVTDEFYMTVHATTKVTCNGIKGKISFDFWKEW